MGNNWFVIYCFRVSVLSLWGPIATLDLVLTLDTITSEISQFFNATLELALKMMRLVPKMIPDDSMEDRPSNHSDLKYYFHVQPLFFCIRSAFSCSSFSNNIMVHGGPYLCALSLLFLKRMHILDVVNQRLQLAGF